MMMLQSSGLALALALWGMVGSSSAQDAREHARMYRACPSGGVAFWMATPRRAPSPPDEPDLIVMEPRVFDVRWAGDDDWIEPRPVPDEVLADRQTWMRPASMVGRHRTLRQAVERVLPEGRPRILLAERTEHWTWRWESTVAVRGDDGVWRVDYVKRYDDGSTEADQRILDEAHSHRLDDLIADPCLALEPFQSGFAHIQSSDNTRWTLEIETVGSTVRVSGTDSGFGRAGAITYLMRGGNAL